jgi:uncharacterized membrane protein
VINTAAVLLDPLAAFAVGGVGSFLGDFFFYPAPMFVSLAAHGLQAAAVSFLFRRLPLGRRRPAAAAALAMTAGSVLMVAGYTLGRAYGYATPAYALLKLPFEVLQAGFGMAVSLALLFPLRLRALYRRTLGER